MSFLLLKKKMAVGFMWMGSLNNLMSNFMRKRIQLLTIVMLIVSCKSAVPNSKETVKGEPTPAYEQQIENLENGIYFRGNGNEPDWSLKIFEKTIEFTSLKTGFESLSGAHVEPLGAMDANVKMYRATSASGLMIIQIMQQECINTMSGEKFSYSVRIEIVKDNISTFLSGCGNYITDSRLHDIWVLEKINGQKMSLTDFTKELPNLEINSSTNQFMGFAGCNRMNGSVFFERGLLRFSNIITTRMTCGPNNKENEFLKSLQNITKYKVENMRLTLTNPSGEELVFKKVD
ncbi:META domain-containing protein [Flavobacterium taihuense]|uniref:META domain-containing protein n=1 Tax=Flavobacterium taihuense TaxID=2857508 RepID=A0ABS6XYU1_9FLAO|nr:META domain-containing protein [Flavobacterium taihuense]MBW4361832.1 META domain-containing protein [Flavobacterium taihuense]